MSLFVAVVEGYSPIEFAKGRWLLVHCSIGGTIGGEGRPQVADCESPSGYPLSILNAAASRARTSSLTAPKSNLRWDSAKR